MLLQNSWLQNHYYDNSVITKQIMQKTVLKSIEVTKEIKSTDVIKITFLN